MFNKIASSRILGFRNDVRMIARRNGRSEQTFMKKSWIYFVANKNNTVLYIGVTSNLIKRIEQHKNKTYKGFTQRYNCDKLVYFEEFTSIVTAIAREKQLKAGSRKRKDELVNSINPEWNDLYYSL